MSERRARGHVGVIECSECEGQGGFTVMHHVTHDMALDAGEPGMEGMPMPENVPCAMCGGTCVLPDRRISERRIGRGDRRLYDRKGRVNLDRIERVFRTGPRDRREPAAGGGAA